MTVTTIVQGVRLVLVAAQRYVARGWRVVPVPLGQKKPILSGWQDLRLTADDLPHHFGGPSNIGIITGSASGDLQDVDCDVPEAVALAAEYLPPTDRIRGRPSNPRSHWWYIAPGATYEKFAYTLHAPDGSRKETCLVEVRADGHQTLVPPSRHPDGEEYTWEELGVPAEVDAAVLHTAAARVAAGALIARAWPGEGSRDDAALALTGWLLRAGWTVEEVDRFVVAVAQAAGDEEARQRAKGKRTREALEKGDAHVYGKPTLADVLADGANVGEHVKKWLALPAVRTSASSSDDAWDEPLPLAGAMPPVYALEEEMLPEAFRDFVWDIAERLQAPVDYAAVAVLVATGAVVGRRIGIHPKQQDDWTVTPTPWGAGIGPSGSGKTPSMGEAMKALVRLIAQAQADFEQAKLAYEAARMTYEIEKTALLEPIRTAARAAGKPAKTARSAAEGAAAGEAASPAESIDELKQKLATLRPPQEPKPRRYRTNDTTVEKLAELLIDNPMGLLLFRDELMGWLRTMEKQGHEGDRAFYNECWGGTTTHYEVDRIGRGSISVPALCVSVLGGIQPGPLRSYVFAASDNNKVGADGFL
jgi:Protein of unknown function (DUF3987)/Bifunctional DNA primase/polymerase, N-terminal